MRENVEWPRKNPPFISSLVYQLLWCLFFTGSIRSGLRTKVKQMDDAVFAKKKKKNDERGRFGKNDSFLSLSFFHSVIHASFRRQIIEAIMAPNKKKKNREMKKEY
jgi:hypothetical protein